MYARRKQTGYGNKNIAEFEYPRRVPVPVLSFAMVEETWLDR